MGGTSFMATFNQHPRPPNSVLNKAYLQRKLKGPARLMGRKALLMSEDHQSYQGTATGMKEDPPDAGLT